MIGGRPTRVEVDLGAIRDNAARMVRLLSPGTRLLAVVKANGYGHGAVPVARAALAGGASALGVAIAEEGVELRAAGITVPILVLGPMLAEQARMAVEAALEVTVYDEASVRLVAEAAESAGRQVLVHLKVDTGMGRLGVPPDGAVRALLSAIEDRHGLRLHGLMTHLASADEPDGRSAEQQWSRFLDVVDAVRQSGAAVPFIHGANSAATLRWPGMHGNQVRVGLALYGVAPGPKPFPLQSALSVASAVAQVKAVGPGFKVGYGETFSTTGPSCLATVPIGYADGYRRAFSNRAEAYIGQHRARVAGRVSMDQTVFVLPADARVAVGDPVMLLGRTDAGILSAETWAGWADTIPYEVFTGLGPRMPRVYRIGSETRSEGGVDANFLARL